MEERIVNVLIGGEAGQGLQTVGNIFAKSIVRCGFSVNVQQTYESRVRGGHNTFSIRLATKKVSAPQEAVDILISLNEETVALHREELSSEGWIIGYEDWDIEHDRWIGVPFKMFGKELHWNVAAIGIAGALMGLDEKVFGETVKDTFGNDLGGENLRVLEASYRWFEEQSYEFKKLPEVKDPPLRLVMNGHEAVALGAISAGVKFCAFYPMSPSTSIPQALIDCSEEMGLVVEQAEDEIAAINMAVGSSYAGIPSIVTTSGGGFALMTETVSLTGVSETPLVIAIGQRPGPGTGLATRTEQGDLWFVLHAGHGEFPRAIFAPGTVEECFHLTRKAVEVAEAFQVPAFVLTDHYLADSYQDLEPIDVESLPFIKPGADASGVSIPYLRYSITEDGVSPRLLPGLSKHLVVADSHEHTEDGHLTEDLSIRPTMVEKRLRKEKGMLRDVVPPEFEGDEKPEILLVSWGSSKGSVAEAAEGLRSGRKKVGTLHFSQLWPLVPDQFVNHLEAADTVVCIESNATGQLAQLIRRQTGFLIQKNVSRYDGLAITPEYILRYLDL
ncbi:MAG: 2-oxoacid:acceptor oxidoreductase subunit alpha [Desulfobacteraceae bacterium]